MNIEQRISNYEVESSPFIKGGVPDRSVRDGGFFSMNLVTRYASLITF